MSQTLISRATWTDDDGTGSTGTVVNNARLQADVYDTIDGLFDGAREEVGPLTISAQPNCALTNAGDTTAITSEVTLAWDTEEHDTGGLHSTSSNTERITVPTGGAGLWMFGASIAFASATGATLRSVYLRKGGSTYIGETRVAQPSAAAACSVTVVAIDVMADASYVEVRVASGTSVDVKGGTGQNTSRFWAVKLA